MQKTLISRDPGTNPSGQGRTSTAGWLDLDSLARVEISSEDALFPIDHAFGTVPSTGWRASDPGPQTVRIIFTKATDLKRIHLHFVERTTERQQEFALYSDGNGRSGAEQLDQVLRQQFTFSPYGTTEEVEDFTVSLHAVTVLELRIDPDRSHDPKLSRTYATLQAMRVA